jgi:hypothetical protein
MEPKQGAAAMSCTPKTFLHVLTTRLSALFVVALILLPTQQALAKARYFCHMRNAVTVDCCCAKQEHATGSENSSDLRALGCCELVKVQGHLAPMVRVDEPGATPDWSPATLPTLTPLLPQITTAVTAPNPRAMAPPWQGPPLFLRHCSLLT